jgi:hypothetical protein
VLETLAKVADPKKEKIQMSVRKRRTMLRKLHLFFEARGKILNEREYSTDSGAPYRLALIEKYLGGYHRMVYYIGFYYPRWKKVEEPTPVVETKPDPLEALSSAKAVDDDDEDAEQII